ncbi:zinc-binding alcohol dehydrogenase family protein, partial [Lactobacillus sp. XV13L]|nr:zinc-binding alcohol dehydrogenase family protein [Lactobacillus sp. XV13L]
FREHLDIDDEKSLVDVEVSRPVATGHDLLVKTSAVAVNPVDVSIRKNGHGVLKEPQIIGWDACGTVAEVGAEVTLFKPGTRVYYAGSFARSGSDSEYQLVDERIVGSAPQKLTAAQAAAMPLTGLTAYEALFEQLELAIDPSRNVGKTILIINGAGGVGSIATQLAHLAGLKVIATASRPDSI